MLAAGFIGCAGSMPKVTADRRIKSIDAPRYVTAIR